MEIEGLIEKLNHCFVHCHGSDINLEHQNLFHESNGVKLDDGVHFNIPAIEKYSQTELILMAKLCIEKVRTRHFEYLSNVDDVTHLWNQRKLYIDLDHLIEKVNQKKLERFNVLFIDLDKFKQVNDQYGHLVGSQMLIEAGMLIKSFFKNDHCYRYGGDEFVVILPDFTSENAIDLAKKFSEHIEKHDFTLPAGESYQITVSTGISECPTNSKTKEEIINKADQMMYHSKKNGSGQIVHFSQKK